MATPPPPPSSTPQAGGGAAAAAVPPPTPRSVGDELIRATWMFQAGCALPTLFVLGFMAFVELFQPRISLYNFITDVANSLLAAGIIFVVMVQGRIPLDRLGQFRVEAVKALLASGMWLWLFLDALLAHRDWDHYYGDERRPRVIRAGIASILLWILFYPPLAYLGWVWYESRSASKDGEGNEGPESGPREDTPLLRGRS